MNGSSFVFSFMDVLSQKLGNRGKLQNNWRTSGKICSFLNRIFELLGMLQIQGMLKNRIQKFSEFKELED